MSPPEALTAAIEEGNGLPQPSIEEKTLPVITTDKQKVPKEKTISYFSLFR
jgi:hypothetical protein